MKRILGSTEKPRLSVSRSNKDLYVQLINDEKGKTLLGVSLKALKSKIKTKTKTEAAWLLGEEVARRAKAKKIKKIIFDRGKRRYLGRIKAVAEGAREGGLDF